MKTEAQTPMPKGHPLTKAWEAWKQTEDYRNTERWAREREHTMGSLWAAFSEGWFAREYFKPGEKTAPMPGEQGAEGRDSGELPP